MCRVELPIAWPGFQVTSSGYYLQTCTTNCAYFRSEIRIEHASPDLDACNRQQAVVDLIWWLAPTKMQH